MNILLILPVCLQMGHSVSDGPKFQKVGTWPISDFDETFPDEGYIWDKIILKISAQTDNPFKSYDASKLAW